MKTGDRLHDNDPRMQPRTLTIVAVGVRTERGADRVRAIDKSGRGFWISSNRIHTDGKPRRGGFDLEVA